MAWRTSDDLLERVRRQAQQQGRSLNDWVTGVLSAATDPPLAGDEAQRVRGRLAAAGLLEAVDPSTRGASRRGRRRSSSGSGGTLHVGHRSGGRRTSLTVCSHFSALVKLYVMRTVPTASVSCPPRRLCDRAGGGAGDAPAAEAAPAPCPSRTRPSWCRPSSPAGTTRSAPPSPSDCGARSWDGLRRRPVRTDCARTTPCSCSPR